MNLVREIFPGRLQGRMEKALNSVKSAQEIRIRVNVPLMLRAEGKEYFVTESGELTSTKNIQDSMLPKDLEEIVYHICRSSLYAYEEEMKKGYLTIEGGCRVGIAGQAVLDNSGMLKTIRNISFLKYPIIY